MSNSDYTVDQILGELEELGFYGIVENYVAGGDASYHDFAADIERARSELTEEELPDHIYRRAHMLLSKLFGSERERHFMKMSELRQIIKKSILLESYDDEELLEPEPTMYEIREWVILELLGMGFHTEFVKYLLQFRDADKRVVNDHFGLMMGRMDRARDLDPIAEEPLFGEPNHPRTMMGLFIGRFKPSEAQKVYINMAQEEIGDDRLEDIIDGIHQHRVKYSTRTDALGRPAYY